MMVSSLSTSLVPFRKFGDSFSDVTQPRSSPTSKIGCFGLNAIFVNRAFLATFCSHIGSCLFSWRSYTCTFPSLVAAANVVMLNGLHATSPTALFKSNDITGLGI